MSLFCVPFHVFYINFWSVTKFPYSGTLFWLHCKTSDNWKMAASNLYVEFLFITL